ncbi:MAG: DUF4388 domain-containing protein [Candidatus Coatesbacteria bacterium]|nr:MAG: DUF4388 domain-containing protein [Candidatus Coatesbacteria bacterium]
MALAGEIADFDLADIIQLIGRGRKTGKLIISGAQNYITIYFKEGRAVFASPAHQRDYIGNILVRRGVVTSRDVEEALTVQRKLRKQGQNVRIGSILAAKGAISRRTLEKFVRLQIEETVVAALSERSGRFEFVSEMELDDDDILIAVDPEWILLESSRQLDEWGELGDKAPAPEAVFVINPDPEADSTVNLEIDDWRLISLVNGIRTVEEIVNRSGLSRLTALRMLSRLADNRIVVENNGRTCAPRQWELVPETYRPPAPDKNLLGRIIDRLRGL